MKQYLSTLFLLFLTQIALSNDIFMNPSFFNENDGPTDVFENNTKTESNDMAHSLLDVLGEQLLSKNENSNLLAQTLIRDKRSLNNLKEKLETLLKRFSEQNPKLATEINHFITNVLNQIRPLTAQSRIDWNSLKGVLPTLQIFCKQLIDRVRQIQLSISTPSELHF